MSARTLTDVEEDAIVLAAFAPGDDCTHNIAPLFATVEAILSARLAALTARAMAAEARLAWARPTGGTED